ncbi:hypothetical protein ACE6H2_015237 [Prunus campanulata]
MYKTGLMLDEVTYSAILDVYAKLGKVEEVLSLYERGRASGWKPDPIAFSVLGKMFGEAGDYDGISYVLQEMPKLKFPPSSPAKVKNGQFRKPSSRLQHLLSLCVSLSSHLSSSASHCLCLSLTISPFPSLSRSHLCLN